MHLPFDAGPAQAGTWVALMLEATAKGTLVLTIAAVAMWPLARTTAAARHWVLTLTAVAVIALPPLSVLLPVWPLPIVSDTALWSYAAAKVGSPEYLIAPRASPAVPAHPAPVAPTREAQMPGPWLRGLLALWGIGVIATAAWIVLGHARVRRMLRGAPGFDDPLIGDIARRAARELGLTTSVRILRGSSTSPLTHGVVEPVVVLPADAASWPAARLRVVLLHELAHVRRHDCLTQLLADMACALYWFNPAVWSSARRLRFERERACDDCVLAAGVRPSTYARHLLDMAVSLQPGRMSMFAAHMAQRSRLELRLTAILDPRVQHGSLSRSGLAIAAIVIAALVVPLAALDPWARTQSPAAQVAGSRIAMTQAEQLQVPSPAFAGNSSIAK